MSEYKPQAYQVWAGVMDKLPLWPPYRTREAAEQAAKEVKSNTEVRPLYLAQPEDAFTRKQLMDQLNTIEAALNVNGWPLDSVVQRINELKDKRPYTIYIAHNKGNQFHFFSKVDAERFASQYPPSVGMQVSEQILL